MPAWTRYLLCLVVMLGVVRWLQPIGTYLQDTSREMAQKDRAKQTLSVGRVTAELERIQTQTARFQDMTPRRYFAVMGRMRYLRDHVKQLEVGSDGARRRIDVECRILFERSQILFTGKEMTRASNAYFQRGSTTSIPWRAIGSWLLCNFFPWYFSFIPFALLIFFLRVTWRGESLAWAIAAMTAQPVDLIIGLLFWGIFIREYAVDAPLEERVHKVAAALDKLRIRRVRPSEVLRSLSEARLATPRLTSPLQSIAWIVRYIWGQPHWGWLRLTTLFWRQPCREAVFVTLVAVVTILIGDVRIAWATSADSKEEKPSSPTLQAFMWVYLNPHGHDRPPTQSLLFFIKNGVEVDVFGYNTDNPILELSKVVPVPVKGVDWQAGAFVNYDLGEGALTSFGMYNLVFAKLGSGIIGGPAYLVRSVHGQWTFFSPHWRALWPVTWSRRLRLGFGGIVSIPEGSEPNLLVGPALQYHPTPKSRIFIRFVEPVLGILKGGVRAEYAHSF